jgi:hypothetical protein
MAAFQLYLQSKKQRKVEWMRDDSHIVFGKNNPVEEGSVRWCVVMTQQSVVLSQNFGAKPRYIFM